jgi:hypothetical protein
MIAVRSAPTNRTKKTETCETYPNNGQSIFLGFAVGDGKNWLVKTKLHLVARAVFATIILSTPVLFAGSGYDISKETPPLPPQPWCETPVPIVLSADIRYKRWEFFGDGQYMGVGASAALPGLLFTNANLHLQTGLAEVFVGYRLINCDTAALSFFAGARYSYQESDLSIFNNCDASWRYLKYDYKQEGFTNKTALNGPFIQGGVNF